MIELANDIQKLIESQTDSNGRMQIRIISPGWGSSGYYAAEVLRKAAPLYRAGVHCYMNHPSSSEDRDRPERSLRDLCGVLAEDAMWRDYPEPGLYSQMQVFSPYRQIVKEMSPHIGVSHRASGTSRPGEAEGRRGTIVEQITAVSSVDLVTHAGRGGALLESARKESASQAALAEARQSLVEAYIAGGMSPEAARRLEIQPTAPDDSLTETLSSGERALVDAYVEAGMIREVAVLAATSPRRGEIRPAAPDGNLTETLSSGERALVDAYVEGGMNREVAVLAATSPRRREGW